MKQANERVSSGVRLAGVGVLIAATWGCAADGAGTTSGAGQEVEGVGDHGAPAAAREVAAAPPSVAPPQVVPPVVAPAAGSAAPSFAGAAAATCERIAGYHATELGSLAPSATLSLLAVRGINASTQIVGVSAVDRPGDVEYEGFLWQRGTMTGIGTLGGPVSEANGINVHGAIVGTSSIDATLNVRRAFVRSPDGVLTALPTLGGQSAIGTAINELGHVVGYSDYDPSSTVNHAFFHDGQAIRDLGTLPGGEASFATSLNCDDHVVGASWSPGEGYRAFLYRGGEMIDLLRTASYANDINDKGQIVGEMGGSRARAFLYDRGQITLLTPEEDGDAGATAINEHGVVVGVSSFNGATRPDLPGREGFVYERGQLTILRDVVDGCYERIDARDINDRGQIVANASPCNRPLEHVVLLLEPARVCPTYPKPR